MFDIAEDSFREKLVEALNASEDFGRETRWFDGSILLEVERSQCWLKVYAGRVIDSMPFMPPFGYTIKLSGPAEPWVQFTSGERTFADLITPGSRYFESQADLETADPLSPPDVSVEGDMMEARRIHEALFHLSDCVAATAN